MPQAHLQLPPEAVDHTIDYLHSDRNALITCAQVCRDWLPASRYHLFSTIHCVCWSPGSSLDVEPLPKNGQWADEKRSLALKELIDSNLCTFRASIREISIYGKNPTDIVTFLQPRPPPPSEIEVVQRRVHTHAWLHQLLTSFARLSSVTFLTLSSFHHCHTLTRNKHAFARTFSAIRHLAILESRNWNDRELLEFVLLFPQLRSLNCGQILDFKQTAGGNSSPTAFLSFTPNKESTLAGLQISAQPALSEALQHILPRIKHLKVCDQQVGLKGGEKSINSTLRLCGPSLERLGFSFGQFAGCRIHGHALLPPAGVVFDLSHNENLRSLELGSGGRLIATITGPASFPSGIDVPSTLTSLRCGAQLEELAFNIRWWKGTTGSETGVSIVRARYDWEGIDRVLEARMSESTGVSDLEVRRVSVYIEEGAFAAHVPGVTLETSDMFEDVIRRLMPWCVSRGILEIVHRRAVSVDDNADPEYSEAVIKCTQKLSELAALAIENHLLESQLWNLPAAQ